MYIAPLKALVRERVDDWKVRFGENLKKSVVELTGDVTPDVRAIQVCYWFANLPSKISFNILYILINQSVFFMCVHQPA